MHIKKLYFSHYNQIKKLIKKNNSSIPKYNFWIRLWNNKRITVGEGLFSNTKLVGYHSAFNKKLVFGQKKFLLTVSSNWNVDKRFRINSLVLINRFFNSNCDLFITTTANQNVSRIWKSFGAVEINGSGCKTVFFKILNYKNFLSYLFKKNQISWLNPLLPMLTFIVKIFLRKKNTVLKKIDNLILEECALDQINKFNKNYEIINKLPKEERSNDGLNQILKTINHNKLIFKLKISYKKKIIGYVILVKEKIKLYKINRMFLAEIRIERKFYKYLNEILDEISIFSQNKDCTLIEFKNLNLNIVKKLNLKKFLIRKYTFNPYLIKFKSKRSKILKQYTNSYWETSYLDGDCLL